MAMSIGANISSAKGSISPFLIYTYDSSLTYSFNNTMTIFYLFFLNGNVILIN